MCEFSAKINLHNWHNSLKMACEHRLPHTIHGIFLLHLTCKKKTKPPVTAPFPALVAPCCGGSSFPQRSRFRALHRRKKHVTTDRFLPVRRGHWVCNSCGLEKVGFGARKSFVGVVHSEQKLTESLSSPQSFMWHWLEH